ncbi:MFS transporter, partial [Klebsiella pneumoniae]
IKDNNLTVPIEDHLQSRPSNLRQTLKESFSCLKNRNCLLAIALIFGFTWAEMGIANFLTLQLTREVGLDLSTAAIISGASGITGWIGQILWGGYSDIKGRRISLCVIILGWILAAALCMFITSATVG